MTSARVRSGWVAAKSAHIRRALGDPEERGALDPGGVEDRGQVLHPLLQGRRAVGRVGEAGPRLVEDDHPGEEASGRSSARSGLAERPFQVGDEARDHDQVERPSPATE